MTDEMLVEAVARAICCDGPCRYQGDCHRDRAYLTTISPTARAHRALAALPPEMRAAGKMKRALARYMNAVSDLHGHFDWESGYGRTRGPVDEEFDAATEEARAALARAEALAKSEAGPVGAACGIKE